MSCLCVVALMSVATNVNGQEKKAEEANQVSSSQEEGSGSIQNIFEKGSLFQFDAREKVRNYNKKIKKEIKRLYVLVKNYGSEVSQAESGYEQIKKGYTKALVYYYQRKYSTALRIHRENYSQLNGLYKKFASQYKQTVLKLLEVAAEKLVESEEKELHKGSDRYKANGELINLRNSFKLRTAYYQLSRAEDMEVNNLQHQAIEHYRLAKRYAIHVLHDLAYDLKSKKEIETKYKKDLDDSNGIVTN